MPAPASSPGGNSDGDLDGNPEGNSGGNVEGNSGGNSDGNVEGNSDGDLDGNRDALAPVLLGDGLARHLGVEVVGWGGGWARAELRVTDDHVNLAGTAHGGTIFALGDVVFAVASNSWGRLAVAQTVEVHYLGSVEVGTTVTAEARERHRTKRTGSYLIDVRARDPEGPLVASLHALVHRTDRWHLGADAWSEDWRATH